MTVDKSLGANRYTTMRLSPFKFAWWLLKTHVQCNRVHNTVQGHPRSLVYTSIKSTYATFYLNLFQLVDVFFNDTGHMTFAYSNIGSQDKTIIVI